MAEVLPIAMVSNTPRTCLYAGCLADTNTILHRLTAPAPRHAVTVGVAPVEDDGCAANCQRRELTMAEIRADLTPPLPNQRPELVCRTFAAGRAHGVSILSQLQPGQRPSVRHSVPVLPATAPRTPQRQPIPESCRWAVDPQMPVAPAASTGASAQHVEDATAQVEPCRRNDGCSTCWGSTSSSLERAGGGIGQLAGPARFDGRLGVFRFGHCPSLDATPAFLPATHLQSSISF